MVGTIVTKALESGIGACAIEVGKRKRKAPRSGR